MKTPDDVSPGVIRLALIVAGCLLFIPFLGSVHLFDWDEINFAECAREMLVTGDYMTVQLNYKPFWEKPPFFIWLSAVSMQVFGVNEFAARFPNAICGILTLIVLFNAGRKTRSGNFGVAWALCYAAASLPQFYFHSGIIDPWFNLFIFGCIHMLSDHVSAAGTRYAKVIQAGALLGLALLTKGPAAFVIVGACVLVMSVIKRDRTRKILAASALMFLVAACTGGLWFLMLAVTGHGSVIEQFISYQVHLFRTEDSGHGGPFYYHFVVLFFGCFPASAAALWSIRRQRHGTSADYRYWMITLLCVVLLLFSVVQTKIVHYSSLCYYPLTFLAATALVDLRERRLNMTGGMSALLLLSGLPLVLIFTAVPFFDQVRPFLLSPGVINDDFALANLSADVSWTGWEALPGVLLLITLLYCVFRRRNARVIYPALLMLNAMVVSAACILIAPKIEAYTQAAAINFYKRLAKEPCYLSALHYHSYAHYFYGQRRPETDRQRLSTDWMLHGEIDKDAYFVAKITSREDIMRQYPQLDLIGEENGYIFLKRTFSARKLTKQ